MPKFFKYKRKEHQEFQRRITEHVLEVKKKRSSGQGFTASVSQSYNRNETKQTYPDCIGLLVPAHHDAEGPIVVAWAQCARLAF